MTGGVGEVLRIPSFHSLGAGVSKPSHQPVEQPLVSGHAGAVATPIDLVSFFVGAEEDGFLLFFRELAPGLIQRDFQVFEHLPMEHCAHGFFIIINHANRFQRTFF